MKKIEWWDPSFGGSMLILAGGLLIGVVSPITGKKYPAYYQIGGKEIFIGAFKNIEDAKSACEHALEEFLIQAGLQLLGLKDEIE